MMEGESEGGAGCTHLHEDDRAHDEVSHEDLAALLNGH